MNACILRKRRIQKCWTTTKNIATISFLGIAWNERVTAGFEISQPFTAALHNSRRRSFCSNSVVVVLPKPFHPSFLSSRSSQTADDSTSFEDDFSRWEKMYGEGGSLSGGDKDNNSNNPLRTTCEVRVVTFDLDNTLWKTGPTIATANDVLAEFLEQQGIVVPVRVEKVMRELFRVNPHRYAPLDSKTTVPKGPVLLTKLRKDAIRNVLETHNDNNNFSSTEEVEALTETAFQVWSEARHESIPQHLAVSATTCLQRIRGLPTQQGQAILIGAITDGNSDPSVVKALTNHFDFCVNAESVGVAKPDKRVYLQAMRTVASQSILGDLLGSLQLLNSPSNQEEEDEVLENAMGPWWVHVGDDFVKDVVAAKSLKLRTIWSQELTAALPSQESPYASAKSNSSSSQKSVEDFVKQVSEMKVIEMSVGADDYLADAISSEFADAVVYKFLDVANVLQQWQNEALQPRMTRQQSSDDAVMNTANGSPTLPTTPATDSSLNSAKQSTVEDAASVEVKPMVESANDSKAASPNSAKFCMFCGNKLPLAAKFCSTGGEKQPDLG